MNAERYKAAFTEPATGSTPSGEANTRAGRALAAALDIRKFEIDLYWKRATYFWAFIAAAFAGYGLTYRTSEYSDSWLSLLFSALGVVFAFAWFLVNRGSKFWQNNWERHVDLLEDMTLGPLYKVVAVNSEGNSITSAGAFSVSRINQLLSLFVTIVWTLLFMKSLGPVSLRNNPDWFKITLACLTVLGLGALWRLGRSNIGHGTARLVVRTFDVEAY